jgi:hypothetical protein
MASQESEMNRPGLSDWATIIIVGALAAVVASKYIPDQALLIGLGIGYVVCLVYRDAKAED